MRKQVNYHHTNKSIYGPRGGRVRPLGLFVYQIWIG